MINIEIDLETLGLTAGAVILSIGAAAFDEAGRLDNYERFHAIIARGSYHDAPAFYEDPKTLAWWDDQGSDARETLDRATSDPSAIHWRRALADLRSYIQSFGGEVNIWSNGANFDIAMLEYAYRIAGIEVPWLHYNTRCHRTIKNLRPDAAASVQPYGTTHNALDDAIYQAQQAVKILPLLADWPSLDTLIFPGNVVAADPDPVLDALQYAASPWGLAATYRNLQYGGLNIPFRTEAEIAGALHFLVGHAIRHGAAWRRTSMDELKDYQARGHWAALEACGFSPALDS